MIDTRINKITNLLARAKKYSDIVMSDSFENQTLDDMKGNVKDIVDEAKVELDQIKHEVDNW